MLTALILILVLTAFSLLAVAPVLVRLFNGCSITEQSLESLEGFSPSAYYPMRFLLADEDFSFLARQPGFDLSLYRKLRRERMLIFRGYLSRLISDFNQLHAAARFIISHHPEDQSHVLPRLFTLRIRFMLSVIRAEISFFSCWLGLSTLAAHTAIARLEEMSTEFSSLLAVSHQG